MCSEKIIQKIEQNFSYYINGKKILLKNFVKEKMTEIFEKREKIYGRKSDSIIIFF